MEFEFTGKFKEGKKIGYGKIMLHNIDNTGIMEKPHEKIKYYGQYVDNMMHDTFSIVK